MSMWVDAKLAAPNDGQEVLVIIDGIVRIAKYDGEYDGFDYDFDRIEDEEGPNDNYSTSFARRASEKVTKWRPLPTVDVE